MAVMEVFTYWNGQHLYDVFNAIKLITVGSESGSYHGLLRSVALAAFMISVGIGMARVRGHEPAIMLISLTFFYGIFFVPRTDIVITDLRAGTNYTVTGVPYGVGLLSSVTSRVGKWLTDKYDTHFTAVDDERFSKYGFLFGHRYIDGVMASEIVSPTLRNDMTTFTRDCVNPELLDKPSAADRLLRTPNVWKFIKDGDPTSGYSLNPGRVTVFSDGILRTCTDAATYLDGVYNSETTIIAKKLGHRVLPDRTGANALILTATPAWELKLFHVNRTAVDALKHYSMANMLRDANANQSGLLASTMAVAANESAYFSMKTLAEGALPMLKNGIESLVIAVFPIVFILVIAAGQAGGKVLSTYAMVAVWIQLWAPLYAVMNSLVNGRLATKTADIVGANGPSIESMTSLMNLASSEQSMMGLMAISIPAIALAIVKGGEVAMGGVVSSLMSPSQSAAGKFGNEAGVGNLAAGNVNWGNTTMGNANAWNSSVGNRQSYNDVSANRTHGNLSADNSTTNMTAANKSDTSKSNVTGDAGREIKSMHGSAIMGSNGELISMNVPGSNIGGGGIEASSATRGAVTDKSGHQVTGTTGQRAGLEDSTRATRAKQDSAEFLRQLDTALNTMKGTQFTDSYNKGGGSGGGARNTGTVASTTETNQGATFNTGLEANANVSAKGFTQASGSTAENFPATDGRGNPVSSGGKLGSGGAAPGAVPGQPTYNHSNSLARGAQVAGSAGAGGTVGGNVKTANQLADIARNESGAYTQAERQAAAQQLRAAVDNVMAATSDSGVKRAGLAYRANLEQGKSLTSSSIAEVMTSNSAGQDITRGNEGSEGKSLSDNRAIAMAAVSMASERTGLTGDAAVKKAMEMLSTDAGFRAEAINSAFESMNKEGGPLAAVSGSGDRPLPRSEESVGQVGGHNVESLTNYGQGQVAEAAAANTASVTGHQHASPTSMPNLSPALNGHKAVSAESAARIAGFQKEADYQIGSNSLAAQLYAHKESGVGTVASVAILGGYGYNSGDEYKAAIDRAAATNPEIKAMVANNGNAKLSEIELDQVFSKIADSLNK